MRTSLTVAACGVVCGTSLAQTLPDYVQLLPLPVPGDAWVWAGSPPGDTSRLFVMEGGGTIRVLDVTKQPGQLPQYSLRTAPFLSAASPQARSVAFSPDFATTGRFYVAQEIGSSTSQIKEFTVSASDPNVADPASVRIVMTFPQLTFDHALGSMNFGRDGMLYIGVGDGMASANGQLISTVKGKMLRIDVRNQRDDFPADANNNYGVPADNPLVARAGAAPEIWHVGLRNPWRWSFDRWNGDVWICDVGGGRAGEIDRLVGTGTPYSNLGWPVFDGTAFQSANTLNPDFTIDQLYVPLLSINRENSQCSTIGGVMYRGNEIRPWRGRFVWSDACASDVYSAWFDGTALGPLQSHRDQLRNVNTGATVGLGNISMIAEDGSGELYVLQASRGTSNGGTIYRVVAAGPLPPLADVGQAGGLVGGDGALDNNDFIAFITLFFNNDPRADMGAAGGVQRVDQRLDNNDFIAFINGFFDGH